VKNSLAYVENRVWQHQNVWQWLLYKWECHAIINAWNMY
jgi:hypothetical protein